MYVSKFLCSLHFMTHRCKTMGCIILMTPRLRGNTAWFWYISCGICFGCHRKRWQNNSDRVRSNNLTRIISTQSQLSVKCFNQIYWHLFDLITPYLLTPWTRVFLEKPSGFQLLKTFPAVFGTRRFIIAFATACHLSLSCASSIQSMPQHSLPEDPS